MIGQSGCTLDYYFLLLHKHIPLNLFLFPPLSFSLSLTHSVTHNQNFLTFWTHRNGCNNLPTTYIIKFNGAIFSLSTVMPRELESAYFRYLCFLQGTFVLLCFIYWYSSSPSIVLMLCCAVGSSARVFRRILLFRFLVVGEGKGGYYLLFATLRLTYVPMYIRVPLEAEFFLV